jgi:GntR family transcriptional regulator of arabinose operon
LLEPNSLLPKYLQLKEYLKKQMQQGEIAYEQQLPSENILAKQFRMSRHTVRQTFGDLENEGWIQREQGRGTFCIYREKVAGRTIAVVATYISEYICPFVIRGIEEVLSSNGYTLILASTGNQKSKEAQCFENLLNQDIAGLIIEPTKSSKENTNLKYLKLFEKKQVPFILIHAVYPDLDPSYIIMDDQKGGYLATNYLLQMGHREIAGIFKTDDLQGVKRQEGFMTALMEYNVPLKPGFIGNYETEQINYFPYQFARSLMQQETLPTAVVCYNDTIAFKVIEGIRECGFKVPEDISVIGYDDSSLAVASEIKLTTIKHPKAEMGRQAAQFIVDMVENRVAKPYFIYQPELVIRSSCRKLS